MRGLPKGRTPMLPIREGMNVQCTSVVRWDSRWVLSVFSPPLPEPGQPGGGGGDGSVFTHRQQVVTCPKAPQASEQQSRGSNPEPMKAVLKHTRERVLNGETSIEEYDQLIDVIK